VLHFVLLIASAAAIYIACEWFVNAVEWLGHRLRVGPLAVGTILAAFGTALPESVVTFVAVVLGTGASQKNIGVGTAMGGPLVLATIAYGVTGWMMLARRRPERVDKRAMVPVGAPAGDRPAPPPSQTPRDDLGNLGKLASDQSSHSTYRDGCCMAL
jgi:cation:H+ antiporter